MNFLLNNIAFSIVYLLHNMHLESYTFFCSEVTPCPRPPVVEGMSLSVIAFTYTYVYDISNHGIYGLGTIATYSCLENTFFGDGTSSKTSVCNADGQWGPILGKCDG